jgi:hypothetical protein
MRIITKEWINQFAFIDHKFASLRELSKRFGVMPPISVIDLIRIADLPPPVIEIFKAVPNSVNPNSQSKIKWKVKNCENACIITLAQRVESTGNSSFISTRLPSEGSLNVTVPSTTFYTLRASFHGKSPEPSKKVGVITSEVPSGLSSLNVLNSHNDKRKVFVWIRETSNSNWQDKGVLEFGKSMTIELQDQHTFEFVCVDPELPVCSGNNPDSTSCRRLSNLFIGDKDGPILNLQVF